MTTSELKNVYQTLKKVYRELEDEALKQNVDISSKTYADLKVQAREMVLHNMGYTFEEYQTADQAYKDSKDNIQQQVVDGKLIDLLHKTIERAANADNLNTKIDSAHKRIAAVEDKLSKIHVPSPQEISKIALDVMPPPSTINQIVKETTIEKPQIIKETRVEKVIEEKNYNDEVLQLQINDVNKRVDKIDLEKFRNEMVSEFNTSLKENIDILGMPDFRKLGMGLRRDIDERQVKTITAGSNVTITSDGNGHYTIASTGGSGVSELAATGTIDDSNTAFTFAQKPSYIVINGLWLKENFGWTWSNPTATLSAPVGTGGSIFGIA